MVLRDSLSTRERSSRFVVPSIVFVLSAVFGMAAWQKIITLSQLRESIAVSRLVPAGMETPAAYALIASEILVAILILIPQSRIAALILSTGLSGLFFGYSAWRIHQDIRVPCSCFGTLFKIEPGQSMFLSFLIALASMSLMRVASDAREVRLFDEPMRS